MNKFKFIKTFTGVLFFITVLLQAEAFAATGSGCTTTLTGVTRTTNCQTRFAGSNDQQQQCAQYVQCLTDQKDDQDRADADAKQAISDCRSVLSTIDDKRNQAAQECAKSGMDYNACVAKAKSCGAAIDPDTANGDNLTAGIQNLVGNIISSQKGGATDACFTDIAAEQSRTDRIDDKIQQLNDQNDDSVTKQADLDDDYNKKKDDIDKQIQDDEADLNKKKIDRQTKQQEESSNIQKAILKSQKTKFDNLQQINKLNIDKANLQFAVQQITIDFSSARMNKTCQDKVNALKDSLTAPTPPPAGSPATAKPTAKKFSVRDAAKMKQDLLLEEQSCLQTEALKKNAQVKGIQDKRAGIDAQVDTLTRANADEDKSVAIDQQSFSDLQKTQTTEEQQDSDAHMKKLNSLSQSLAKFSDTVAQKKKALDDKINSRKQQIQALILEKSQKVDRFGTVSSALTNVSQAQNRFQTQCCSNKPSVASSPELKGYCRDSGNSSSGSDSYNSNSK